MSHFVAVIEQGIGNRRKCLIMRDNQITLRDMAFPFLFPSAGGGGRSLEHEACLYPDAAPLPHGPISQGEVAPS